MSMDGARAAARRDAWRKIHHQCACGFTVHGNGKSHQRACHVHLRESGWPLTESMREALREDGLRAPQITAVELALGRQALAGDDPNRLDWRDFRDLVWRLASKVTAG